MLPTLPQHKYHHFGPYLAEMPVDPSYCDKLLKLGKKLKTSYREHLIGKIFHEYLYPLDTEPWIFNEFQIYVNTWIEGFKKFSNQPNFNPQYQLTRMWINKMKAKEYNPIHIHTGCDLSFVLWLEVPQKMLDESKNKEITGPKPGDTGFLHGEDNWSVVSEQHISPRVNTLMIFPSTLRHQVIHFDSKVTRISVSGNIKFI